MKTLIEEVGPKLWKDLHETCEKIPCQECYTDCKMLISGIHDAVNIKIDKSVHDRENFDNFVRFVNSMSEKCKKTNCDSCSSKFGCK